MKLTYKHTLLAGYVGYITQAIVNNLAPLLFIIFRDSFNIELSKITLLITFNFLIQLGIDAFSSKFVDKIGYRRSIVTAHIFSAVGLILMGVLPFVLSNAFAGLIIAAIIYAIGGGLIEVLISPIVEACPTDNKASAMSLLHSFYCWGSVAVIIVTTLLLNLLGKDKWYIIAIGWALVPIINGFLFARVPINTLDSNESVSGIRQLAKSKMFWLFMIIMICAGASEQSMSQWASAFAESALGVSKTVGDLLGPCMFSLCMGAARLFYAKRGDSISLLQFIMLSAVLCIAAYLLVALSPVPALSLLGCALCGLSVGILWPGVFSLASARFPKGGTAMFALLALAGDVGCGSGPSLVGWLSDLCGGALKTGLIGAILFPLLALVCALLYRREGKRTTP